MNPADGDAAPVDDTPGPEPMPPAWVAPVEVVLANSWCWPLFAWDGRVSCVRR